MNSNYGKLQLHGCITMYRNTVFLWCMQRGYSCLLRKEKEDLTGKSYAATVVIIVATIQIEQSLH